MICSALVLLMIPGVGLFYSGLARRKSALSLIMLSLLSIAIVDFQWFFWGYSLTFSHTGSVFIGETAVSLDEIAPKLKAIAKNGYDEQIFVRGDKGVAYGTVMRVMGRISAGGFRKVSLVTEVEDGG